MLINLSNHPYEKWDEKQREAADITFGKVQDYPFPLVNPEADLLSIESQAEEIIHDILNKYPSDISIHLMGEFVLCYQLAKRFENNKIPCIASTTEREVIIKSTGEKISMFHFVKFRPYFNL